MDNLKLMYSVNESANILGISRATIYDEIRRKRLRTVKVRARRLVPYSALESYVDLLTSEAEI